MNKKFTRLTAALALLVGLAIPLGMWGQTRGITMDDGYIVGTNPLTSVSDGDLVVWGTSSSNLAKSCGSNWVYCSETQSEWIVFTVVAGNGGFYLKTPDDKYVYSSADKKVEFSSTNQTLLTIATSGNHSNIVYGGSSIGYYTFNSTGIRPYKSNHYTDAHLYGVTPSGSSVTYTVTYHANVTGTANIEVSYAEGADVTVADNTFTNPGYAFTEWNTEEDGSGDSYSPGDVIEDIDDDIDLYAQWEESDEATATLTQANLELTGSYTTNTEKTIDGITYVYSNLMKNNSNIQAAASTGTIKNATAYPGDITSVVITHSGTARATTINGSADGTNWTQVATGSGSITADFTGRGYKYFQITRGSNAAYWTRVEITYSTGGSSSLDPSDLTITNTSTDLTFDLYPSATAQVINYTTSSTGAITITPETSTYFSYVHDSQNKTITVTPVAVTPSAQTVTISQAQDETHYAGTATFTVSVTNSDPDVPGTVNNPYTVAEAIAAIDQLGTINDAYVAGIVCQVDSYNSNYSSITYWISDDGTTTTKLQVYSGKGIGGADFSSIDDIQVNDIVTVTGKLKKYNSTYEFDYNNELVSLVRPLTTMDAIYAKAQEVGTTETEVKINFGGWVVTGIHQSTNSVFVTDGTKGFIIRQENHGFEVGNTLTGGVTCNLSLAGSFNAQVTGITASTDGLTVGTGGTVTPAIISLTDLSGINTGAVVAYENLTYQESTGKLTDGTNLIRPVQHLLAESYTFEDGMAYNITGIIWGYGSDKEIYPRSAEDIVADNTPFINLDQYTFNYDYVAQGGYHTITYGNLDNPGFGVVYCDAQGNVLETQTQPAMIARAEVVKRDNVDYYELYLTVALNESSDSRTTYLKVCTTNTPITYYSDLITVSQTGYVPSITVDPTTVSAPVEGATGTISAISDIIYSNPYSPVIKYYYYEGETLTETTAANYSWLTATITNGSPLVTNGTINYTISANDGAARTAYMKVYAKDYYNTDVYSELITISQEEFVVDYATLPFSWAGGTSSELTALTGVTGNSLGDYAATNAPYRVQFDKTGDYIQVKTDSQPGIVTIGVKMIGGGNTSYITVQGSADGETFDDGEVLEISGSQNDILTLTSSRSFGENVRYVRLYFTKGSNVGVGPISITKYVAPEEYDLTVTLGEHVEAIYVFNTADYSDALIAYGAAGTVQVLEGTSIEVSPDAAQGYMISSLLINNEDVFSQMSGGAYTFTMTGDVTITATAVEYVEPYTILFSVNGEEYEAGEMAILPEHTLGELPVPENIPEGFTFVGWMESPVDAYYNATTAPTMVSSTTVPEDDMILDAVFCISETAQGTYVLSNAAPTDGDWVVLAVNVDGTYYAMNGPTADELTVTNNTIVGTLNAAFEAKKITQNDTDYIGLTKDGGTQYVHLNSSAIKIANGTSNGLLEFTQSGTGYLVSTEATVSNVTVTRYIQYSNSVFTVTTDDEEASTLYVFKYIPGATTNKDYTTLVTNHAEGFIAEEDAETLYGIHYINGFVIAGDAVTNSGKLVINAEGMLDMYGSTLINTTAANFVIEDGGQLFHTDVNQEVKATMKKEIQGYGSDITATDGWYFVSNPLGGLVFVDGTVSNSGNSVNGMITDPATTYDLYLFENTVEKEWLNYKDESNTIQFTFGGSTAVLYANQNNVTLTFVGSPQGGEGTYTTGLSYESGASYEFNGWTLTGNPFACEATVDMPFYRMNEDRSGLTSQIEANSTIGVMEGVFVEGDAQNNYVTFTRAESSASDVVENAGLLNINVSRNRGGVLDNAIVRFDGGSMLGKFTLKPNSTKVYITEGDRDYAIVRSNGQGEMPVSFKADKNGSYTISVNAENVEMNYLHLIDNKTGADVDLLATPSYTFEARTTDYASRFRLVFSANNENGASTGSATFAYYNGSEWVISNMGEATLQVVDVMGRVLSTETVNGNATMNLNQTPGVYMLRLVNGDSVKVQKVVVR